MIRVNIVVIRMIRMLLLTIKNSIYCKGFVVFVFLRKSICCLER